MLRCCRKCLLRKFAAWTLLSAFWCNNARADEWNWKWIQELSTALAKLLADPIGRRARSCASRDRDDCVRDLRLKPFYLRETKLLLAKNVWTAAGVASGVPGVLERIHWTGELGC